MTKARAKPKSEQVLELVRRQGVIRPKNLDAMGVPREYLRRLHAQGMLEHPGRGLYVAADARPTENQTLAEACARVPHGVVCLLSALQFHDLTTQAPFEVWMAIGEKTWLPKVDYPPLRFVRFSHKALTTGVEERPVGGVGVRVFNPAKTIADCFKYRNKIGLGIAVEALRVYWQRRRPHVPTLMQYARVCRVNRIKRPYVEALQ
jgi:predicted transcriptional regulator of viral defense system